MNPRTFRNLTVGVPEVLKRGADEKEGLALSASAVRGGREAGDKRRSGRGHDDNGVGSLE